MSRISIGCSRASTLSHTRRHTGRQSGRNVCFATCLNRDGVLIVDFQFEFIPCWPKTDTYFSFVQNGLGNYAEDVALPQRILANGDGFFIFFARRPQ